MNTYAWRAARGDGKVLVGRLQGASPAAIAGVLENRGLLPIEIAPSAEPPARGPRVSRHALAAVLRGLAGLVDAGVPIARALPLVARHAPRVLSDSLAEAERQLREGRSLAVALGAGPGPLPEGVRALIGAGERQGRLGSAIAQAAAQVEREAELLGRTRQALVYPAVLLATGIVSIAVILAVVVPRFAVLLADLGQSLPASTRGLLMAGQLLARWWPLAAVGATLTIAAFARARATPAGRRWLDRWMLTLPIVGPVRLDLRSARICRAIGTGLDAGLPLPAALGAGSEAGHDLELAARISRVTRRIREGQRLGEALRIEQAIAPVALDLIAVGEASGELAPMAGRAAEIAEARGERALRAAVAVIEPALVLLFGAGVGLVALALLQAVYAIRPVGP